MSVLVGSFSEEMDATNLVFDDISEAVVPAPPGKGRKRKSTESARDTAKKVRHSGNGKEPTISCTHDSEFCKAAALTPGDLAVIHSR